MIFRAFEELTFAFPAVFWSRLNPPDAAKLLAQEPKRDAPGGDHVVGRIDGSAVIFERHRRFTPNPFAPIFVGRLRADKDGTQLVGEFRRRKIMLLFTGVSYFVLLLGIPFSLVVIPLTAIWLGVSILGGILAGAVFALVVVGILFAEATLIRLAINAAKRDSREIAEHIDDVFSRSLA